VDKSALDKSADAFRTIGEMAKQLGVKTHILRYWEEQFPMLTPLKRAGGRRHYRADDAAMLETIHHLLNQDGYTIKGARKFLTTGGKIAPEAAPISVAMPSESGIPASALRQIRDQLSAALAAA
jgi:DNA-binding transcriptional MerR regulator